jgi:protein-disulfide isomerase
MQNLRPFLIIGLVLAAILIGSCFVIQNSNHNQLPNGVSSASPSSTPLTTQQPKKLLGVVIKVEEFGDYQCPPCGALHPALKKINEDYGSNIDFIFHNFPLEQIHKNALAAAQAAEAARMQNRFREMHDRLYETQQVWSQEANPKPLFGKYALDLGLDTAQFFRDMGSEQVRMRIQADKDMGVQMGVTGTPTVFIEGRELKPEATTSEGIRKAIDYVINQKARSSSP